MNNKVRKAFGKVDSRQLTTYTVSLLCLTHIHVVSKVSG